MIRQTDKYCVLSFKLGKFASILKLILKKSVPPKANLSCTFIIRRQITHAGVVKHPLKYTINGIAIYIVL